MRNKRKIIRQSLGIFLGILGLWLFQLTATIPQFHQDFLVKLVNDPVFQAKAIGLYREEEEFPLSWGASFVVNRYGFLKSHQYTPEEIPVLPTMPEPEPVEEPPPVEVEEEWLSKTMTAQESYYQKDGIYVSNNGKVTLTEEDMMVFAPTPLEKGQEAPQILIYHSHGTESYRQTEGYTYEESDPYRTLNMDYNITAVGAAMTEVFQQAGYSVIHDKTLHDYPDYNSSYNNSAVMLANYLEEYPSLQLIFDVHRDALTAEDGTPYQLVPKDWEEDIAQVMLVVGTDGGGYDHPKWRDNFSLALSIQSRLLDYGDFSRPITLRSSRFNQHYSTGALLLEIGGHGNTFPQALAGGVLFAETVVEVLEQ